MQPRSLHQVSIMMSQYLRINDHLIIDEKQMIHGRQKIIDIYDFLTKLRSN
jgi:hypothetical protein